MTTTATNLPTWCQLRAERFRDMEQHEMAMYPDQDCRDVAIVEHVVRVLANPDLPESSEVLAIVAEQHRLELNATGTAEWAKNRINELTAELAETREHLALDRQAVATLREREQQARTQLADALNRAHRAETDAAQMTRANQEITAERDAFRDSALMYAAQVSDLTSQLGSVRKTCEAYENQPPPIFRGPGLSERGEGYNAGTRDMARAVLGVMANTQEPCDICAGNGCPDCREDETTEAGR